MPFAGYKDFKDCVNKNQDKKNPEGYCAAIKEKVEGKSRGEGQGVGGERQGDGGPEYCVCPKCGKKIKHTANKPCKDTACPSCGAAMNPSEEKSVWDCVRLLKGVK